MSISTISTIDLKDDNDEKVEKDYKNYKVKEIKKPLNWNKLALFQKVLYYRNYLTKDHAVYVDKLESKKIVKNILGDEIEIPRVIRVLDGPNDISKSDFQSNTVIKASHGSGWNIFIDEKFIPNDNKVEQFKKILKSWNKVYNNGTEVQYKYVKPRFFIEELVDKNIIDCKFNCIRGKVIPYILIKIRNKKNFYDLNWQLISKPEIPFTIPKLKNLDKLVYFSEILSKPFEYVRIDFYVTSFDSDKIYFSEYTFTPNNGIANLSYDKEFILGKEW